MACDPDRTTNNAQYKQFLQYTFSWCLYYLSLHASYNAGLKFTPLHSCSASRCVIQLIKDIKVNHWYRRMCRKWQSCPIHSRPCCCFRTCCPQLLNFRSYYFKAIFVSPCFVRTRLSRCWGTYCRSLSCGISQLIVIIRVIQSVSQIPILSVSQIPIKSVSQIPIQSVSQILCECLNNVTCSGDLSFEDRMTFASNAPPPNFPEQEVRHRVPRNVGFTI